MLYEIIYRSTAQPELGEEDLLNILATARKFNSENHITGCLLFNKGTFVQILEGESEVVNVLYSKIREDRRHHQVETLHIEPIEKRLYADWSMAFKEMDASDMQQIESALGIKEFMELNTRDEKSTLSKELFWVASRSIIN